METAREAIERAFVTAHLLTASARVAEDVTIQAIESWNPREESWELLFDNVVRGALRAGIVQPSDPSSSEELNAVLLLPPRLRRCFVLRILAGLPARACARLLRTSQRRVEDNTRLALQNLSLNLQPRSIAA